MSFRQIRSAFPQAVARHTSAVRLILFACLSSSSARAALQPPLLPGLQPIFRFGRIPPIVTTSSFAVIFPDDRHEPGRPTRICRQQIAKAIEGMPCRSIEGLRAKALLVERPTFLDCQHRQLPRLHSFAAHSNGQHKRSRAK